MTLAQLEALERRYTAALERVEQAQFEASAWYGSILRSVFLDDAELARQNIEQLEKQYGFARAMDILTGREALDTREGTRVLWRAASSVRDDFLGECDEAEWTILQVREAWLEVKEQARRYDEVSRC